MILELQLKLSVTAELPLLHSHANAAKRHEKSELNLIVGS